MTFPTALPALPAYDLGPDRGNAELIVNLIIYGLLLALLLSVLWVLLPFAHRHRESRRRP